MNGGKVHSNHGTASSTSADSYAVVSVSRSTMIMNGGEISGNTITGKSSSILKSNSYGAGVFVCDGATFIMSGSAKVANNKLSVGKTYGANVYVSVDSYMIMVGGTIESNSTTADAMFGGGVTNIGTLYMLGGTIQNTKATTGGAIANGGELYIAGGTISGCNSVNSSGVATTYGNAIATAKNVYLAGGTISGDISIGYQSSWISTTVGTLKVISLSEIIQSIILLFNPDFTDQLTNEEELEFFKESTGEDFEGLKSPYALTLCQLDSSTYEAKAESYFTSNYANKTKAIVTYSGSVTGSLSHFTLTSPTTLTLAMGSGDGYDTNSIYLKK